MPQIAKCYDIYLPIGGVTSVRHENPLRGLWKSGEGVYHDEIIVFTVIDLTFDRSDEGDRFLKNYKEILKGRFQQEEVLITAQVLEVI